MKNKDRFIEAII